MYVCIFINIKISIPVWNTDFLASNNYFHTLLNSLRIFHRAGFFHSPGFSSGGIIPFTWNFSNLRYISGTNDVMTSATPQYIIGSLGWWTISFLPPFEGNNDTFSICFEKDNFSLQIYIFRLLLNKSDDCLYLYIKIFKPSFPVNKNHLNLWGQVENCKWMLCVINAGISDFSFTYSLT